MKRRNALVASLVISVVVLAAALMFVNPATLGADLRELDPGLALFGLGVLMFNYWLRALRFRLLLDHGDGPIRGLFGVVCIYATLNYLLPARLGELSLPVLLKRVSGQTYSIGTASLIAARMLDLGSLLILIPLALAFSHAALPAWAVRSALIFLALSLAGVGGAMFWLRSRPLDEPLDAPDASHVLGRATRFASRVTRHLALTARRSDLLPLAALSLGIWLCIALNFYVIVAAVGLDLPIIAAFVVTVVMIPLSFLPAQGFANLGTHEVAWLSVLLGLGLSADVAARTTLLSHLVLVGYVAILGTLGWLLVTLRARSPGDA